MLRLLIENPLDEAVKIDLGPWSYGRLRATLTRPDKQISESRYSSGFGPSGIVSLAPHSFYETPLLANRWFDFDEVGTYVLDIALPGPLRNESGAALSHSIKGRTIVNVGLRDPEQLQRICADLTERATKEPLHAEDRVSADEDAMRAADALSYIKDPVAVPFFVKLLRSEARWQDRAIQGLARIADRESIEVLISQLRNQSQDLREQSREALSRVERTTKDIAIQQRIRDTLR
jgi:hypothetical protein